MKLPNFRVYTVQATYGVVASVAGLALLAMLGFCVFRGFKTESMSVLYNPEDGLGQYRPYLVFGLTGACLLAGGAAALLGFSSLGQKRNTLQGRSWLGLVLGALVVALAPVLLLAWRSLSEPLI